MAPKKKDEKKEEVIQEVADDSGSFVFPDHHGKYTGQFQRREGGALVRHGRGSFSDDHMTYDGFWKDDLIHGDGVLSFADGSSYSGTFVDGQFDGHGTFRWGDGSHYDGQWRNNRMHGEGQYTDRNGVLWTGKFYNGTGPGLRKAASV